MKVYRSLGHIMLPGDIAGVGIFSDNADKTIFKFLESFELGYIDWGNNHQHASKLSKHLSDDLKDKLMTRSDSYALMREWLVQNYGGAARILNDTVMALTRRKKPTATDRADRFLHTSAILAYGGKDYSPSAAVCCMHPMGCCKELGIF